VTFKKFVSNTIGGATVGL